MNLTRGFALLLVAVVVVDANLPRLKSFIDSAVEMIGFCPKGRTDLRKFQTVLENNKIYLHFYDPETKGDHDLKYSLVANNDMEEKNEDIGKWYFSSSPIEHKLDASRPTLVFVHGFNQDGKVDWLAKVRRIYDANYKRTKKRFNIFIADWSHFAKSGYKVATHFVPHVGEAIGKFVETELLSARNFDPRLITFVGFSLGAHVVGNAARFIQNANSVHKIGKIIALDPAGPCFRRYIDYKSVDILHNLKMATLKLVRLHTDSAIRLRSDDALVVEARYSDILLLGSSLPIGSVDIFLNDGKSQPGASNLLMSIASQVGLTNAEAFEAHGRAPDHATAGYSPACQPMAYKCASYKQFINGECGFCDENNDQCYHANSDPLFEHNVETTIDKYTDKSVQTFYLKTGASEPFCEQLYQVVVVFDKSFPRETTKLLVDKLVRAKATITLFGAGTTSSNGEQEQILDEDVFHTIGRAPLRNHYRSYAVSTLITNKNHDKRYVPMSAMIKSEAGHEMSKLAENISIIYINYMSDANYNVRQKYSAQLCRNTRVAPDQFALFSEKFCSDEVRSQLQERVEFERQKSRERVISRRRNERTDGESDNEIN